MVGGKIIYASGVLAKWEDTRWETYQWMRFHFRPIMVMGLTNLAGFNYQYRQLF
jgi:hypothetical protein